MKNIDKERVALTEKVHHLSQQNASLASSAAESDSLRSAMTQLNQRYLMVLEIMGEKEEELQALQAVTGGGGADAE